MTTMTDKFNARRTKYADNQQKDTDRAFLAFYGIDIDEIPDEAIIQAIQSGNVEVELVRTLLVHGVNIDETDAQGRSALMLAVQNNDALIVKLLITRGADSRMLADNDDTVRSIALRNKNLEIITLLLQDETTAQDRTQFYTHPLIIAAAKGYIDYLDVILSLLPAESLTNIKHDGKSALEIAWLHNRHTMLEHISKKYLSEYLEFIKNVFEAENSALARKLIELNLGTTFQGNWQREAVVMAAKKSHVELGRLLLDKFHYANQDVLDHFVSEGDTEMLSSVLKLKVFTLLTGKYKKECPTKLLCKAVRLNKPEVVKTLLENGINLKKSPKVGANALSIAVRTNNIEMAKLLLKYNAPINGSSEDHGHTPLTLAAEWDLVQMLSFLIDSGADINSADYFVDNALLIASANGHLNIVQLLIAKKANIEAVNNIGETAIIVAAKQRRTQIVQLLINAKANLNHVDKDGRNAFWHAVNNNDEELVEYLLKNHKTNIDQEDTKEENAGITPLMAACANGSVRMVDRLLKHGATLNHTNKIGFSALFAAIDQKKYMLGAKLIDLGADVHATINSYGKNVGMSVLMEAARNYVPAIEPLLEKMIAKGANINARALAGQFAGACVLNLLVARGAFRLARKIIEKGVDINAAHQNNSYCGPILVEALRQHEYEFATEILLNSKVLNLSGISRIGENHQVIVNDPRLITLYDACAKAKYLSKIIVNAYDFLHPFVAKLMDASTYNTHITHVHVYGHNESYERSRKLYTLMKFLLGCQNLRSLNFDLPFDEYIGAPIKEPNLLADFCHDMLKCKSLRFLHGLYSIAADTRAMQQLHECLAQDHSPLITDGHRVSIELKYKNRRTALLYDAAKEELTISLPAEVIKYIGSFLVSGSIFDTADFRKREDTRLNNQAHAPVSESFPSLARVDTSLKSMFFDPRLQKKQNKRKREEQDPSSTSSTTNSKKQKLG